MTTNIKQIVAVATNQVEAIEKSSDLPVPNDAKASIALLVYQAGVEAMREAAVRNLRVQGFNIHANQTLDLKV